MAAAVTGDTREGEEAEAVVAAGRESMAEEAARATARREARLRGGGGMCS